MDNQTERPDVSRVLRGLKDFQRDTVDYIFRRMYTDQDNTRRFLLADEVGLGKTLVARGLIAKAIDHLWATVKRIDVVYICSNSDIARQNLDRLQLPGYNGFTLASRITMLPTFMKNLNSNKLNFISFTPATSFDLKTSLGRAEERVLLFHLLDQAGWIDGSMAAYNIFQGGSGRDGFRKKVRNFDPDNNIDPTIARAFRNTLKRHIKKDREEGRKTIKQRFNALCDQFTRSRTNIPTGERAERNQVVGQFRELLAETCFEAIEPDIIILDEFQRFKQLLAEDSPMSEMAKGLFNYSDDSSDARVLLLSATPYKMYTLAHESDTDNHYEDFLRTIRFLQNDADGSSRFEALLGEYRRELFHLADGNGGDLRAVKGKLERMMRKVMVRTERLASSADRDGMLKEVPGSGLRLQPSDVRAYSVMQKIARLLGSDDVMEYWKSAPYLLNFMEDYSIKKKFEEAKNSPTKRAELIDALAGHDGVLLPWKDFEAYNPIDSGNARLRSLLNDTVESGAWQILWIPPALPYYTNSGPFAAPSLKGFTKRLIFSSWKIVPKAIATLVSYEAERRMMCLQDDNAENSPEARKKRRPLLVFAKNDGRLTGMPVLGLLYPCAVLARDCDPLALSRELMRGKSEIPSGDDILAAALGIIQPKVDGITIDARTSGPEDVNWYWAAPILMDMRSNGSRVKQWFEQNDLDSIWSSDESDSGDEDEDDQSHWSEHVAEARRLINGDYMPGKPPKDLAYVLAQMAVAGPGIVALRALVRVAGGSAVQVEMRNSAAVAAWGFRNLFNQPESIAMIRGMNNDEPYWRRVLEYCLDGGLQAVIDEYLNFIHEAAGMVDRPHAETAQKLAETMNDALTLRTSTIGVDEIHCDARENRMEIKKRRVRVRFALRYGDEQSDDEKSSNRKGQVQQAFNSPFWPFVIASTSVGQEGLDFHPYCHAIVHWNLPSNPVDMEQREGRVHRYKGHAVRKNLAQEHGSNLLQNGTGSADPWKVMFLTAKDARQEGASDIIPYWVSTGAAKIERHIPALPLSRDHKRAESVRHALTVYRMVFGQNRQEDLLAYLLKQLPHDKDKIDEVMEKLKIDLSPRR